MTLVYRDKCRHFNGIQHKTCDVGVAYLSVRDSSQPGPYRWPCVETGNDVAATVCPNRSLLTQQEHADFAAQIEAAWAKACAALEAGKCHICGAAIEPSTVVGRCKYAACGHRIGQVATGGSDG